MRNLPFLSLPEIDQDGVLNGVPACTEKLPIERPIKAQDQFRCKLSDLFRWDFVDWLSGNVSEERKHVDEVDGLSIRTPADGMDCGPLRIKEPDRRPALEREERYLPARCRILLIPARDQCPVTRNVCTHRWLVAKLHRLAAIN